MAGLVVTKVFGPESIGARYMSVHTVAFDSSYPTGGESLSLAQLGIVDDGNVYVVAHPSKGYVFEYDDANAKLKAYYGDNNNASDGALIEVASATDLSGVTAAKVEAYSTRI